MSRRYTVSNIDGEDFETPAESRSAQLRQALLMQQMMPQRGGGGESTMIRDTPAAQVTGGLSDLEAQKALIREKTAAELAVGGQGGSQALALDAQQGRNRLDVAGLSDTGMTKRAEIQMGPANRTIDMQDRAYLDMRPATIAGAEEKASASKLGVLRNGITGEILGEIGHGAGVLGGMDPAQRSEFMSRAAGSLFNFDPTEESRTNRVMDRQTAMAMAQSVAQNNPQLAGQAMDAARRGDYKALAGMNRNSAMVAQDPAISSRVQSLMQFINDNDYYVIDSEKDKIEQMYQEIGTQLQAQGVPEVVMDQVLTQIRQALAAKGHEIHSLLGNTDDYLRGRFGP